METIQVRAQIRPQRFGALIGPAVTQTDLTDLVRILSSVWAGRYTSAIRVGDPLSERDIRRVIAQHPDVLLGAGVDIGAAAAVLSQRVGVIPYLPLSSDLHEFFTSSIRPVPVARVLQRLLRDNPVIEQSAVTVWEIAETCPLFLFYAVAFGLNSPPALNPSVDRLKAENRTATPEASISDFIRSCIDMASRLSWLDLGSYGLNTIVGAGNGLFTPHTIILVADDLHQLMSYWNIRSQLSGGASGVVLPLPVAASRDSDVIELLVTWTKAVPLQSNFMRILCDPEDVPGARLLASSLRKRLTPTPYQYVDVQLLQTVEPVIVAVDGDHQLEIGFESDVMTFDPPSPKTLDAGAQSYYMVDLLKDRTTGRSPKELFFPYQRVAVDVLRTAAPPELSPGLSRVNVSAGNVSLRVDQSSTCRFQAPTSDELFGEMFREAGFIPVSDEKRSRYQTVIDMFGGLSQTAQALLGFSGRLLDVLARNGPLTIAELHGAMAAFAKRSGRKNDADWLEIWTDNWPEVTKRVTRNRFNQYGSLRIRSEDELSDLLAKFCRLRVLSRLCRLDRCERCLDQPWVPHVDLTIEPRCSNCGAERSLRSGLPIGYALNPVLKMAIKEGITPVVLTARFLHHMTSNGFLWLPGAKAIYNSQTVDFDILAICDGILIAAECKDLRETPASSPVWKAAVVPQYLSVAQFARRLGADAVLLSALAQELPVLASRAAARVRAIGMGARAIAGRALEQGWEEFEVRGVKRRLSLRGLLPSPPRERLLRNRKGPRHISM